jgi:FtsH-binding integral membrane protein
MNYLKQFSKLIHHKKNLLRCIFTTLLCQLIATSLVFIVIYRSQSSQKNKKNKFETLYALIALILGVILIICMTMFQMSFMQRSILFTLFSILQGLFLGFSLRYIQPNAILSALLFTVLLFFMMLIFGFILVYYQMDLSWLGIILFFLLLGLIAVRLVSIFFPYSKRREQLLTTFALLLFSIYIIYDTNNILLRYDSIKYHRDCILGALDYYLDIINIFVNSVSAE